MADLKRATIPNSVPCAHCGAPLDASRIEDFRITPIEAREYRGQVQQGEPVCAVCWHEIRWPTPAEHEMDDAADLLDQLGSEWFP